MASRRCFRHLHRRLRRHPSLRRDRKRTTRLCPLQLRDAVDVFVVGDSGGRLHETSKHGLRGLVVVLRLFGHVDVDVDVDVGVVRWIRRGTQRVVGV